MVQMTNAEIDQDFEQIFLGPPYIRTEPTGDEDRPGYYGYRIDDFGEEERVYNPAVTNENAWHFMQDLFMLWEKVEFIYKGENLWSITLWERGEYDPVYLGRPLPIHLAIEQAWIRKPFWTHRNETKHHAAKP